MCFHSKQSKDAQTLEKRYNATIEKPAMLNSGDFNGFEHPHCAVITNNNQQQIQFSQWGLLPQWAKDKELQNSTLNAKFETIHEKSSFKNYSSQRCLIPADGFYEWQWLDSRGKQKLKYLLHLPGNELFSFAGLWNVWNNPTDGSALHTFTILTTEANALMSEIHNSKKRMPMILTPDIEKDWLNTGHIELLNDYLQAKPLGAVSEQLSVF